MSTNKKLTFLLPLIFILFNYYVYTVFHTSTGYKHNSNKRFSIKHKSQDYDIMILFSSRITALKLNTLHAYIDKALKEYQENSNLSLQRIVTMKIIEDNQTSEIDINSFNIFCKKINNEH